MVGQKFYNEIACDIKDKQGELKYTMRGKFTTEITARNVTSGETWTVYKAPEKPYLAEKMFNMSTFGLQLNLLSDELKKKLPPTDSRLRPDIRFWEECKLNEATKA